MVSNKQENKVNKQGKLLKISEVCEILNVHSNTLRQWDEKGILKAVRFRLRRDRRYKLEDVRKLLEGIKNEK